ncbi:MAG TPA: hypothetical protein VMD59_10080, partial [Acidimicrobiales bacterium]|nr:hypothetical protein [Acidimicrobiales bacterium]
MTSSQTRNGVDPVNASEPLAAGWVVAGWVVAGAAGAAGADDAVTVSSAVRDAVPATIVVAELGRPTAVTAGTDDGEEVRASEVVTPAALVLRDAVDDPVRDGALVAWRAPTGEAALPGASTATAGSAISWKVTLPSTIVTPET